MKWKAEQIPKHTLMLKYLRIIMKPAELEDLVKRYVAAKKSAIERRTKKQTQ